MKTACAVVLYDETVVWFANARERVLTCAQMYVSSHIPSLKIACAVVLYDQTMVWFANARERVLTCAQMLSRTIATYPPPAWLFLLAMPLIIIIIACVPPPSPLRHSSQSKCLMALRAEGVTIHGSYTMSLHKYGERHLNTSL